MTVRRKHSEGFKAKVAFEALKGEKTIAQISSIYAVHPSQIISWKKTLVEGMKEIFVDKRKSNADQEQLIDDLYRQLGKKEIENEWLKKKIALFN